ncbi:MAG TPA: hypothetical protein VF511_10565 [Chthoniobacterales bacterium]
MRRLLELIRIRLSSLLSRIFITRPGAGRSFGPLFIDRGHGLLYDVERDLTWLQDTNYAKTVGHAADGQMTWDDAKNWVAGLHYRGVTGWRLPTALNPDGSGPCVGDNCRESELGHLVFTAFNRPSPGARLINWEPFSIYWTSTEASASEAFAFKMAGLKQGRLAKNPWMADPALGAGVPLTDVVRTWPVHDGDVGAGFFRRLIRTEIERRELYS